MRINAVQNNFNYTTKQNFGNFSSNIPVYKLNTLSYENLEYLSKIKKLLKNFKGFNFSIKPVEGDELELSLGNHLGKTSFYENDTVNNIFKNLKGQRYGTYDDGYFMPLSIPYKDFINKMKQIKATSHSPFEVAYKIAKLGVRNVKAAESKKIKRQNLINDLLENHKSE